jgi:hypothetical protein
MALPSNILIVGGGVFGREYKQHAAHTLGLHITHITSPIFNPIHRIRTQDTTPPNTLIAIDSKLTKSLSLNGPLPNKTPPKQQNNNN